jgi:hypothetical protein
MKQLVAANNLILIGKRWGMITKTKTWALLLDLWFEAHCLLLTRAKIGLAVAVGVKWGDVHWNADSEQKKFTKVLISHPLLFLWSVTILRGQRPHKYSPPQLRTMNFTPTRPALHLPFMSAATRLPSLQHYPRTSQERQLQPAKIVSIIDSVLDLLHEDNVPDFPRTLEKQCSKPYHWNQYNGPSISHKNRISNNPAQQFGQT